MNASQKTLTRNLRVILDLQRTSLCTFKSLAKRRSKGQSVQSLCRESLCFVSVLRSVDFLCIFVSFFYRTLFKIALL